MVHLWVIVSPGGPERWIPTSLKAIPAQRAHLEPGNTFSPGRLEAGCRMECAPGVRGGAAGLGGPRVYSHRPAPKAPSSPAP